MGWKFKREILAITTNVGRGRYLAAVDGKGLGIGGNVMKLRVSGKMQGTYGTTQGASIRIQVQMLGYRDGHQDIDLYTMKGAQMERTQFPM